MADGGMHARILLLLCKHIIITRTLLASGARSTLFPAYSTRTCRNLIKLSGASPNAPSRAAAIFSRTT